MHKLVIQDGNHSFTTRHQLQHARFDPGVLLDHTGYRCMTRPGENIIYFTLLQFSNLVDIKCLHLEQELGLGCQAKKGRLDLFFVG